MTKPATWKFVNDHWARWVCLHCHLLLKRSTITDDLIPEDLEKFFTGNIYEEPSMLISTKLLLSTTDKGVQVST